MTTVPSSSESAARQKILQYLTDTLRHLPDDISLSWQHPGYEHAVFGDALVVAAVDATEPDVPLLLNAEYWVVGVQPGKLREYFRLILGIWKTFGWRVAVDEQATPQLIGRARTLDDFGFTLVDNGKGDLAITASSPWFAQDATGGDPLPSTITHP
ncbi:hypothetical protein ACFYO1_34395 [Nocardia sp. NPDC006044]|uniref:hypothetical protein n=1 Tax=Nocardia sp. NPDC006044 TaxID=3364306 RepID=UPI00369705F3